MSVQRCHCYCFIVSRSVYIIKIETETVKERERYRGKSVTRKGYRRGGWRLSKQTVVVYSTSSSSPFIAVFVVQFCFVGIYWPLSAILFLCRPFINVVHLLELLAEESIYGCVVDVRILRQSFSSNTQWSFLSPPLSSVRVFCRFVHMLYIVTSRIIIVKNNNNKKI